LAQVENLEASVAETAGVAADCVFETVAHMSRVAASESKSGIMLDTGGVTGLSGFTEGERILAQYGIEFD
jgi:hypothetical protein